MHFGLFIRILLFLFCSFFVLVLFLHWSIVCWTSVKTTWISKCQWNRPQCYTKNTLELLDKTSRNVYVKNSNFFFIRRNKNYFFKKKTKWVITSCTAFVVMLSSFVQKSVYLDAHTGMLASMWAVSKHKLNKLNNERAARTSTSTTSNNNKLPNHWFTWNTINILSFDCVAVCIYPHKKKN